MNNPSNNEFGRYVTVDTAPLNSICESRNCGKLAAHRYLVTAGIFHCNNGLFCRSCGETYTSHIERMSRKFKLMDESLPEGLFNWVYQQVHDGSLCEPGVWKTEKIVEEHREEIYTWGDYLEWLEGRFAQG